MSTTSQVIDFSDLFTDLQNRVRVTGAEEAETRVRRDKGIRGIVRLLARRFALTEQQVIDAIKAEFPTA